jgi:prophage DNA circulation protein
MVAKWEIVLNFSLPYKEMKNLLDFKSSATTKSKKERMLGKAKQSKAKQSKAKQSKAKQSKANTTISLVSSMVVTVVKIESRSFSSAEIQHLRTENTRSDYNWRILMIYMFMVYRYKL